MVLRQSILGLGQMVMNHHHISRCITHDSDYLPPSRWRLRWSDDDDDDEDDDDDHDQYDDHDDDDYDYDYDNDDDYNDDDQDNEW